MAKARMLHNKISASVQVNRLSLPAKLLFTWLISHADDEGRLKGDPEYIKATVVPMTNWSPKKIESYLQEINQQHLIHYWQEDNEWYIEFMKWEQHQQIRGDRFKASILPSFPTENDNQPDTNGQPNGDTPSPQSNEVESNPIQNISNEREYKNNTSSSKRYQRSFSPFEFTITNERDEETYKAWSELSSDNPESFGPVYVKARDQGLPVNKFREFTERIKQSQFIVNAANEFDKLVKDFFRNK